jgi:hypothetical protein
MDEGMAVLFHFFVDLSPTRQICRVARSTVASRLSLAIGGGRQFMLLRLAFIVEALTGPQRSRSIVYGCLYGLDVAYDFVLTTRCFVQSIGTIWLTFTTEPLFVIASRFKTVGSPDSEQAASELAICSEFMHFIISSTHFSSSSFKRI